jgi:hypothetical protein
MPAFVTEWGCFVVLLSFSSARKDDAIDMITHLNIVVPNILPSCIYSSSSFSVPRKAGGAAYPLNYSVCFLQLHSLINFHEITEKI